MLQCSFGVAPAVFNALPDKQATVALPVANILDNKPLVNISPFGMCNSLANPTVAAATAAALGVLTPMPCIPVTSTPWAPGSPTVLIKNAPALTNNCKCMCSYGGMISIQTPGQFTVQAP